MVTNRPIVGRGKEKSLGSEIEVGTERSKGRDVLVHER